MHKTVRTFAAALFRTKSLVVACLKRVGLRRAALPWLGVVSDTMRIVARRLYCGGDGWAEAIPTSAYFDDQDPELARSFADEAMSDTERYKGLFDYFLAGFLEFSAPSGERVSYPGFKGNKGRSVEGLEGFARTVPLFCAWLASGRPAVISDPRHPDIEVDLRDVVRRGILTGTDPASAAYWGDIVDYDQRIVEAADVALILWLSRDHVWSNFSPSQRHQVSSWLQQAAKRNVHANNWLLFRVQIIETLRSLGMPADEGLSAETYEQFKSLYLESGWFSDPPKGVDYYNPWAISYALFWIDQVNPAFDRMFIREALRQSGSLVLHLVGPNGVPIMGRSQCYRMAIPAPVVMQPALANVHIHPGQARRALDVVWKHFIARRGLAQGRAEQGYYQADPRFLDHYSGPGSCQWSLRSLVPAFLYPEHSAFWQAPQQALPIELADYRISLPKLGWIVEGHRASGEIVIRIPANGQQQNIVEGHSAARRFAERLLATPFRPFNDKAKYKNGVYSSTTEGLHSP
ncbi:DUF2264 domain-containing protein [Altericroceibacterium xinjiangense]|uniref:DUF2264 domain-containing protein n=1 Tax=Altericroceibacterium xinjiangense TaxID=762261 RepID=UPI000F7E4D20|nr:DUF2264 domain-containing protein [Altericroceibacterium xinjiangense]